MDLWQIPHDPIRTIHEFRHQEKVMITTRTTRILLLDDAYDSMWPLKSFLESLGSYEVILTAQADVIHRLAHEAFDLVCIDIMIHPQSLDADGNEVENVQFPGVNWQKTGIAFLQHLHNGDFANGQEQATSPDVPVLILSAVAEYSLQEIKTSFNQFTRYMEKPFDVSDFLITVEQLLQPV